jgi:hypothetical protein
MIRSNGFEFISLIPPAISGIMTWLFRTLDSGSNSVHYLTVSLVATPRSLCWRQREKRLK